MKENQVLASKNAENNENVTNFVDMMFDCYNNFLQCAALGKRFVLESENGFKVLMYIQNNSTLCVEIRDKREVFFVKDVEHITEAYSNASGWIFLQFEEYVEKQEEQEEE